MTRIIYLHGFASSPQSRKAQFFREKFGAAGVELEIPHLADQGFERLTISGQMKVIERAAKGEPVIMIGSSMGGYLAALYASLHPEVRSVIAMAPAFGFARRWGQRIGAEAHAKWQSEGFFEVHHYGDGKPARVGYQLIEDGLRYPDEPITTQPTMILHGVNDDVVPVEASIQYAAQNPAVRLQLFESGHELTDVMDAMWVQMLEFIAIT